MFMYIRSLALLAGSSLLALTLSAATHTPADPDNYPYPSVTTDKNGNKINNDGAIILPDNFKVTHTYRNPLSAKNYNLGVDATADQVKAWDTDTRPDGKGLPEGSMSVEKGAAAYSAKCASCHGDFGEGVGRFPVLSGGRGTLTLHPKTGGDPAPLKTVGSYLPYISPLFWYIQTAMPLSSPKSLSDSEVYGILGYLLQLNEVKVNGEDIEDDTIIDRAFIKSVVMPNQDGFEYNNLRVADTQNTRCMKDCVEPAKMKVLKIVTDGTVVQPEFGEERWYYGAAKAEETSSSLGKSVYQSSCAGCHESGLLNSPKVGDKAAWAKISSQGMKTMLDHAINGYNAMPPRGGDASLDDASIEAAVTYMVDESNKK